MLIFQTEMLKTDINASKIHSHFRTNHRIITKECYEAYLNDFGVKMVVDTSRETVALLGRVSSVLPRRTGPFGADRVYVKYATILFAFAAMALMCLDGFKSFEIKTPRSFSASVSDNTTPFRV